MFLFFLIFSFEVTFSKMSRDPQELLQRQSKKLARVSMKMVASERQVVTPEEKAVERRVSRVIRRSMTVGREGEENNLKRESRRTSQASAAAAEVALHMSSTNPLTGKWQPRMGPNAIKREPTNEKVVIPQDVLAEKPAEPEPEPKRVHRKSRYYFFSRFVEHIF